MLTITIEMFTKFTKVLTDTLKMFTEII